MAATTRRSRRGDPYAQVRGWTGLTDLRVALTAATPYGLTVLGLGCMVAAAFTVAAWAGLLAAGAALLIAEWHTTGRK